LSSSRLPPLTALKAFECTGRLLSFTMAAHEMGVTPGAVSRQIKVLEDYLGLQLFVRSGRDVSLTKPGSEYLVHLTEAFARIRLATSELVGVPDDAPLRVSSSATFTMRWLLPRLMSFHSRHADSNLQLTMNLAPVDFQRDDLDATLKLGNESTPHSVVRMLFRADLVPVCSPRLASASAPLDTVDDLSRHTLLHSSARPANWPIWLNATGRPGLQGAHQLKFESSSLAYQAAIEGVGVAMAQLPLVLEDLRANKLIMPFPVSVPDSEVYNLIWPDRTPRNRSFLPFRDWIVAEAQTTSREIDELLGQMEQLAAAKVDR
jgi:LysR family transcriptional regulator, glycine cleavage system transcriptional activator